MRSADREEFLKILRAHLRTIDVCRACAETTRDLAAEVKRGGLPSLASAQPAAQGQAASPPAPPRIAEQVEVVATKVPERIDEVPAAIEVFSGDELRAR